MAKKTDLMSVPATFTNRVAMTISDYGLRITFGESTDCSDKDECYRSAVIMPLQIAEDCRRMLNQALEQFATLKSQH
jgi:hypothetical protein